MHKQNMRGFPKNGATSNVPTREYKTTGTAATWTIPAGVTAFNIYVIGGGGGTGGSPADSTVTYNSVTYTGGAGSNAAGSGGAGGAASGGDLNLSGQRGGAENPTFSLTGNGGMAAMFGGSSYGAGANGSSSSGGGGAGTAIKRIVVVPGQTTATYTVGAGGTGAGGGLIVFEY